ncbi:hypothetical protein B0H19DRAFT_1073757 [Mycena capillaripes]|nr:hypothetical protein B0H19DRAFT_1073757 [Mycena capillaripes]
MVQTDLSSDFGPEHVLQPWWRYNPVPKRKASALPWGVSEQGMVMELFVGKYSDKTPKWGRRGLEKDPVDDFEECTATLIKTLKYNTGGSYQQDHQKGGNSGIIASGSRYRGREAMQELCCEERASRGYGASEMIERRGRYLLFGSEVTSKLIDDPSGRLPYHFVQTRSACASLRATEAMMDLLRMLPSNLGRRRNVDAPRAAQELRQHTPSSAMQTSSQNLR